MRIVSWNVNGLRASWHHGLPALIDSYDADIFAFQETKTDIPVLSAVPDGYYDYWSFCTTRKGYSGTLCVRHTFSDPSFDTEGRVLILEYSSFFFMNVYAPNSQRSCSRHDYRLEWDVKFLETVNKLNQRKPVIICGDFNVPVSDTDIYKESKWQEINSEGFLSTEREGILTLLDYGFVDTFRLFHPNDIQFTWWSNRRNRRGEGRGWRLDYFFASRELQTCLIDSSILTDVFGSDHCPILLETSLHVEEQRPVKVNTSTLQYCYTDLIQIEKDQKKLPQIRRVDLTSLWESVNYHV